MIKKKSFLLILLLSLALAITGCSDEDSPLSSGSGELALSLADAPVNNVAEVNVTLSEVQVSRLEDGQEIWEIINDFADNGGEATFDLLTLRFDQELLGQEMLAVGHYNQIRLIVAADEQGKTGKNSGKSYVVFNDGSTQPIKIPSGTETGLKINHDFTIEDGKITRLLLDADVSKIMHSAGNSGKIILRPTAIKIIDQVISGGIKGRVADTTGQAITGNDVLVEAWNGGTKVASTVATVEDIVDEDTGEVIKEAGSFLLRGLEEGTYTIKVKVVTGEDLDQDGNPDEVLNTNGEVMYQQTNNITVDVIAEQVTPLSKNIILEEVTVDTTTTTEQ
ncbi:hypothetical protein U472_11570 [Orenia metallireducens]|uniref:DUF4382 domain-containing protein n=1 Tax=Orenia metallireducens TaxID=1413210 RepID=A0A1C0A8Q4_9FIRM|nr:DUF4382 domain-containing protein [Orenia metallireducens]OCL26615.1 hypothetical protein U472_11570 [Orenia metallireducens]